MTDPPNATIADALDELGDLYELDGAIVHRVVAYRNAAKAVREASVSVAALAREGRATELPGIGKTLQEKIQALLETGDDPGGREAAREVPARARRHHAAARARAQARAPALRRARHRLARGAARGGRGAAPARRARVRARRSRRRCSPRFEAGGGRAAAAAGPARAALPIGEAHRRGAARGSRPRRPGRAGRARRAGWPTASRTSTSSPRRATRRRCCAPSPSST